MWSIEKIEKFGFKLISNEKLWCHFRGHGFDVFINLDTREVEGNVFNFKSFKNSNKGHFRAKLEYEIEMQVLLKIMLND